jgi:hypothetical protein
MRFGIKDVIRRQKKSSSEARRDSCWCAERRTLFVSGAAGRKRVNHKMASGRFSRPPKDFRDIYGQERVRRVSPLQIESNEVLRKTGK